MVLYHKDFSYTIYTCKGVIKDNTALIGMYDMACLSYSVVSVMAS